MESKLYFWGHNCFFLDQTDTFLVTDPWLTPNGAFYGSWFQYPQNHHLQAELINLSKNKQGWIYITHEHQDHFDLDTLSKLDKKTRVVIPCFEDKFLFTQIQNLGMDCIEVEDGKRINLSDEISIKLLISDIGVDHDSAAVISTKSFTFFNQNDCRVFDRLGEISDEIDFYSVQYSGANHHPSCYSNLSSEEKIRISADKVNSKLNSVAGAIEKLKPRYFIPAAGPAIFPYLDASLSLGKDNIFIHQDYLNKFFQDLSVTNYLFPRIGEQISDQTSREPIPAPTLQDLDKYKRATKCFWEDMNDDFDSNKLKRAIMKRLDSIKDIDFQCEYSIEFKWGENKGESIFIDLENKNISDERINKNKEYLIKSDKKYFKLLYSARWQDVSLTLRGSAYRNPDEFNNIVNIFLFSEPENIRYSLLRSLEIPNERIVVNGLDGKDYEINRYCPHQGADLCNADVNEKNELVCPRHGWRFNLSKGGIDHSGRTSISSKLINREE